MPPYQEAESVLTTTHLCEVNETERSETWGVRNPFKPAPRAAPSLLLRDSAERAGAWKIGDSKTLHCPLKVMWGWFGAPDTPRIQLRGLGFMDHTSTDSTQVTSDPSLCT